MILANGYYIIILIVLSYMLKENTMTSYFTYTADLGLITLAENGKAITALTFGAKKFDGENKRTLLLDEAYRQLEEYLNKKRMQFELPIDPQGTPFQKSVWSALLTVPYGFTSTYGRIAAQIGKPRAARAVGMANNKNPIAIIIPCHRIIGSDGFLTGYAGGLEIKRKLLETEGYF